MNHKAFAFAGVAFGSLLALALSLVAAEPEKNARPAEAAPEFKLPPGWTAEDFQACMAAGTPGKMHEHLLEGVGVWHGKSTMWMTPDSEPLHSEATNTVTSIIDGRYIRAEIAGEMPGMGPFQGFGTYGYDNVSQQFVATWIDNHSTGMMNGVGSLSEDGKTLTWKYTFNCPLTKKPTSMRDVETITGPNTKTLDSYTVDPKSGKEYRMMHIKMTRKESEKK